MGPSLSVVMVWSQKKSFNVFYSKKRIQKISNGNFKLYKKFEITVKNFVPSLVIAPNESCTSKPDDFHQFSSRLHKI